MSLLPTSRASSPASSLKSENHFGNERTIVCQLVFLEAVREDLSLPCLPTIVPVSNSEKAVGLYPSATLNKIEGANHGFNAANLGSMGSMMGASADYDSQVIPIVQAFLKK